MRGAATTSTVPGTASASRPATVFSRPWAFCLFAVRASVQQALAMHKHHGMVPAGVGVPQPNSTIVMLVESDVSLGSRSLVP